jgi:hypothetical protein
MLDAIPILAAVLDPATYIFEMNDILKVFFALTLVMLQTRG